MRLPSNTRHVVCYISKKGLALLIMIMVTVVGLWDVFVIFFCYCNCFCYCCYFEAVRWLSSSPGTKTITTTITTTKNIFFLQ